MHQWDKRAFLARELVCSSEHLLDAAERAHDLNLRKLSMELLELGVYCVQASEYVCLERRHLPQLGPDAHGKRQAV
jgi:hypothetical protein